MTDSVKITVSDRILAATVLKLLPRKVTPNQITVFRFFTVPFIAFLIYTGYETLGVILFAVSAFSDAADGALARVTNRVSEWGKIYDPIADKLLIGLTALLIVPNYLNFQIAFWIIFIEMILIGAAYYVKNRDLREIQANAWGKAKMICQSFGVGMVLLYAVTGIGFLLFGAQFLLYSSFFFAVISLITYGI